MKKTGVIILNYKLKNCALRCLDAVLASNYQNKKVYLVDNDSQDNIIEATNNYPEVTFIQNKQNLGFSGGNNVGIEQALSDGCDAVFIVNPDVVVEKNTMKNLVEGLEKYQSQIVGPKILFLEDEENLSGNKKIWFAGGIFDKANVLGSHEGVDQTDSGQFDQAKETDYVSGASMMVTKEVFEKIGLFDEDFFLYYEDTDFCLRAKKEGFKVMYIPQAITYHENAKSTGLGSPIQDYYITRNRMILAKKWLPLRTQFALFREAIRNLSIKPRKQAFFDFLFNRLGGQIINA